MNTTDSRRGRLLTWLENGTAQQIRKRAGLTFNDVAERIGVSHMTVRRCESERYVPRSRAAAIAYYELLAQLRDEQEGAER
ncbi:helix-turn-helix domain-containing protein [Streptomyces sp. NPDC003710]